MSCHKLPSPAPQRRRTSSIEQHLQGFDCTRRRRVCQKSKWHLLLQRHSQEGLSPVAADPSSLGYHRRFSSAVLVGHLSSVFLILSFLFCGTTVFLPTTTGSSSRPNGPFSRAVHYSCGVFAEEEFSPSAVRRQKFPFSFESCWAGSPTVPAFNFGTKKTSTSSGSTSLPVVIDNRRTAASAAVTNNNNGRRLPLAPTITGSWCSTTRATSQIQMSSSSQSNKPRSIQPPGASLVGGMSDSGGAVSGGASSGGGSSSWAAMAAAAASKPAPPPPPKLKKAPIYITVGPPCAGKTTILSKLLRISTEKDQITGKYKVVDATSTLADITIDDQQDVYVPVPTRLFLNEGIRRNLLGVENFTPGNERDGRTTTTTTTGTLDKTSGDVPILSNHPTTGAASSNKIASSSATTTTTNHEDDEDFKWLNQTIQDKSLGPRIYDDSNAELRAIMQRLHNVITPQEFRSRIRKLYSPSSVVVAPTTHAASDNRNNTVDTRNNGTNDDEDMNEASTTTTTTTTNNTTTTSSNKQREKGDKPEKVTLESTGEELIKVVEEMCTNHNRHRNRPQLPQTVDVFVVESIFRPHSQHHKTGLEMAVEQLNALACNGTRHSPTLPLAWGNTNTRPREYKTALEAAEKSGRPVYFIVYANKEQYNITGGGQKGGDGDGDGDDNGGGGIFLPEVDLNTLLKRSVRRLLKTGKYVPAKSVVDSLKRIENLMQSAVSEMKRASVAAAYDCEGVEYDSAVASTMGMRSSMFTKLELDTSLAKMANYKLNPDRTVTRIPIMMNQRSRQRMPNRSNSNRAGRGNGGGGGGDYPRMDSSLRGNATANNNTLGRRQNYGNGDCMVDNRWTHRDDSSWRQQQRNQGGGRPYNNNVRGSGGRHTNNNMSEGNDWRGGGRRDGFGGGRGDGRTPRSDYSIAHQYGAGQRGSAIAPPPRQMGSSRPPSQSGTYERDGWYGAQQSLQRKRSSEEAEVRGRAPNERESPRRHSSRREDGDFQNRVQDRTPPQSGYLHREGREERNRYWGAAPPPPPWEHQRPREEQHPRQPYRSFHRWDGGMDQGSGNHRHNGGSGGR